MLPPDFISDYEAGIESHEQIASSLEKFVRDLLSDRDYHIHLVVARNKSAVSLKEKITRKGYTNPARQVTDLYGVRVITYYSEQVDLIADRLSSNLVVDELNCVDKRAQLISDEQFGYKSVHLVVNAPPSLPRQWAQVRNVRFEIQIRSVLDQAWAEIEHEVVYKSGIQYPPEIRRRFAAIAANFEILEREFISLREKRWMMVDDYLEEYRHAERLDEAFDAARLVAALEWLCPAGKGWRQWSRDNETPEVTSKQAVTLLREAAITNALELSSAVYDKEFRTASESLASLQGGSVNEMSHVTVVGALAAAKDFDILRRQLPGLAESAEFVEVFTKQQRDRS